MGTGPVQGDSIVIHATHSVSWGLRLVPCYSALTRASVQAAQDLYLACIVSSMGGRFHRSYPWTISIEM
jgi:hypothetical protein